MDKRSITIKYVIKRVFFSYFLYNFGIKMASFVQFFANFGTKTYKNCMKNGVFFTIFVDKRSITSYMRSNTLYKT